MQHHEFRNSQLHTILAGVCIKFIVLSQRLQEMGPFKCILIIDSWNTDRVVKADNSSCPMRQSWVINFFCPPDKMGRNRLSPLSKKKLKKYF